MTPVVTQETCRNLGAALRHEWLATNGLGGYASSTIHNCNTRKYHGLLVASLPEPAGRFVLLSKFDDTLITTDGCHPLSCNRYSGTFYPEGHRQLAEFSIEEGPVFLYKAGTTILRKRLLMVRGESTVLVRYELVSAPVPVTLRLNPLLAFRRHHELKHEDS